MLDLLRGSSLKVAFEGVNNFVELIFFFELLKDSYATVEEVVLIGEVLTNSKISFSFSIKGAFEDLLK